MSAFVMTWFRVTSVPSSSRSPALSRVVIVTLASVSPASSSEKLKSEAAKVYAVSSLVVTVLSEAVGALLVVVPGPLTANRRGRVTFVLQVAPLVLEVR